MKVITYYRFSTREQAEGTSIKRQSEDCTEHAAQHGWTIVDTLIDEGKSAFSGANRDEGGELGRFEIEVRSGLHHGKTLLVERLDRISRQGYDETSDFVKLLTRAGVSVATVDGEFYEAGKKLEIFQVMKMLYKAEAAHDESVKKSGRLRSKYKIRREEAKVSGVAMTKNLPPYLCIGKDGKPAIREGRDALVRRVFELADNDKLGSLKITQRLNAEFPTWAGLNGSTTKQWNRTFVSRLLQDRQVTGEYQPYTKINSERVPDGEAWPNYFPCIISHDQFERVNGAAESRKSPAGKRSTVVANLFAGMLRCHHCEAPMMFERKRTAGSAYHGGRYTVKNDEAALRCSNAFQGGKCHNKGGLSYYGFERAMLDACLHLALDDRAFSRTDDLSRIMGEVAKKRREVELATKQAESLWSAYAETASKMAMAGALKAEAEAERLGEELAALEKGAKIAAGQADAEAHLSRVAEFRGYLRDDDLDVRCQHRAKVANGFRTVVQSITFDDTKTARVKLIDGLRTLTIHKGKVISNMNFDHWKRDPSKGKEPREAAMISAYVRRDRAARMAAAA